MVEHRGLAPSDESGKNRLLRSQHYNNIFGPFRLSEGNDTSNSGQSEDKTQALSEHYNEEWSRWMERHYNDGKNQSGSSMMRAKKGDLDSAAEMSGPKVVVIGASHAGIAFADKLRKNNFTGPIAIFDSQVGGPMERPPLSKGFLRVVERQSSRNLCLGRKSGTKAIKYALKHSR